MNALIQDLAVGLIALGAAGLIIRRSVALFTAKKQAPGCPSCAAGARCASSTVASSPFSADQERKIIRPLIVYAGNQAEARLDAEPRKRGALHIQS